METGAVLEMRLCQREPRPAEVCTHSQSRKLELIAVNPGLASMKKRAMCFGFTLISISSLITSFFNYVSTIAKLFIVHF